jgi:hypothetical protein
MGSEAVNAFVNNDKVQKMLNMLKLNMGEIKPADLPSGASFYGTLSVGGATVDIYSYNEWYLNDSDVLVPMLDSAKIIIGSPKARTSRSYGAILDVEYDGSSQFNGSAQTYSVQYFAKSWMENDPSGRNLLVQSSPVVCMHQVDAFGCGEVV